VLFGIIVLYGLSGYALALTGVLRKKKPAIEAGFLFHFRIENLFVGFALPARGRPWL
jgi:hypothetical protein